MCVCCKGFYHTKFLVWCLWILEDRQLGLCTDHHIVWLWSIKLHLGFRFGCLFVRAAILPVLIWHRWGFHSTWCCLSLIVVLILIICVVDVLHILLLVIHLSGMVHVAAGWLVDRLIWWLFTLGAALNPVCIGRHFRDAFTWRYSLLCVWGIQCFLLIDSLVLIVGFQGVLCESTSTWWCIKWILHLVLCRPRRLLKHGIPASHLWSTILLKTWSLWPFFGILIHHLLLTAMLSKCRSWATWLIDILKILLARIDLIKIVWISNHIDRLLPDLLVFIWWPISFQVLRWLNLIFALLMVCTTLRLELSLIASKFPLFLQESWGRW